MFILPPPSAAAISKDKNKIGLKILYHERNVILSERSEPKDDYIIIYEKI